MSKPDCRMAWRVLHATMNRRQAVWCVDQLISIAEARVNGKPRDRDAEMKMANALFYLAEQLKRMAEALVEDVHSVEVER